MKRQTMLGTGFKYLGAGALLWAAAAPWALAGPEQETALAEKEFARGDLVASTKLWVKAAQQGYAPAQARLGDILDVSEEDVQAVEWYRKAALQGNAAGEYGLGQMYAKGEGVKKDEEQARALILKAAEKNYIDAVSTLIGAYRTGAIGFPVDNAQAEAWEVKMGVILPGYRTVEAMTKGKVTAKKGSAK